MSPSLNFHVAESLQTLCVALADILHEPSDNVLEPVWTVLPSSALRQWLDANLSLVPTHQGSNDGIAANLRYLFPTELVRNVERAALSAVGQTWTDWSTESLTLRILHLQSQSSLNANFAKARAQAESIDEIARWRPELFDDLDNQLVTTEIRTVIEALGLAHVGPSVQSRQVREILTSAIPIDLPSRLAIFGLVNVPGGESFTSLIHALATRCDVDILLPTPSIETLRRRLEKSREQNEDVSQLSWTREADEAFDLWATLVPDIRHWQLLASAPKSSTSLLGNLQDHLRGVDQASPSPVDKSIQILGCVGNARQTERLRDALFEILRDGDVQPHEVLVVSPDLGTFEPLLDRYWNYPPRSHADEAAMPRLRYEMTEHSSRQLTNRFGASISLLHLIGNYVTLDQMQQFLSFPCVASALKLEFDDLQRLWYLSKEGHLTFGVTSHQRASLGAVPHMSRENSHLVLGTWERVVDRVALASLLPNESTWEDIGDNPSLASLRLLTGWPLGEANDATLVSKMAPLLRLLDREGTRRASDARQSLHSWIDTLGLWMKTLSVNEDDDSFEQALARIDNWLSNSSENLGGISLTYSEFQQFWQSLDDQRSQPRVFGRGGVVVSDASSLPFAPYKVICVLGFDEDKIFPSPLPRSAMRERRVGDPDPRRTLLGALLAAVLCATEHLIITWNNRSDETGRSIRPSIALDEFFDALGSVTQLLAADHVEQSPRHAFISHINAPQVFDGRFRSLSNEEAKPPAVPASFAPRAAIVSLSALRTFLRDPLAQYVRAGLQSMVPPPLDTDARYPRITPDALTLYQLRQEYVRRVSQLLPDVASFQDLTNEAGDFSSRAKRLEEVLRSDERFAGDIPPLLWSSNFNTHLLNLFAYNDMHDASDFSLHKSDDDSVKVLDVDSTRLTISSSVDDNELRVFQENSWIWQGDESFKRAKPTTSFGTRYLVPSAIDDSRLAKNVMLYALDVIVLKALFPDSQCSTTVSFLPKKLEPYKKTTDMIPVGEFQLNPAFAIRFEGSHSEALSSLSILLSLYEQASARPLPLFRATNVAASLTGLHFNPEQSWDSYDGVNGDRSRTSSQMFYDLPLQGLRSLSPDESFPFAAELTAIFRPLTFTKLSGSKRPVSQRLASLNLGFADLQDKSTVAFSPFTSNSSEDGGA